MNDSNDRCMGGRERLEGDVTECQECGEEIDFTESGPYWKTADDRFWHDECHDALKKLDRTEEIREDLIDLMVPEDCFDGLSDEFHNAIDQIQVDLSDAIQRERLKADQGIPPHGSGGDRDV